VASKCNLGQLVPADRWQVALLAGLRRGPQRLDIGIDRDLGPADADTASERQDDLLDGGAGNEICFFGAGTAYLWQYTRWVCTPNWNCFQSNWVDAVRSYWPGNGAGYFQDKVGDLFNYEYFSAWGPFVNAGYWAQHSNAVTLTN
jgi:hypothetical protein